MGPIWGRQDPCGLHVGPVNFAIWESCPLWLNTHDICRHDCSCLPTTYIDGYKKDRSDYIASALELLQSCADRYVVIHTLYMYICVCLSVWADTWCASTETWKLPYDCSKSFYDIKRHRNQGVFMYMRGSSSKVFRIWVSAWLIMSYAFLAVAFVVKKKHI